MGGQMGNKNFTVSNLEIIDIDIENNIIKVKGAVPGHRNSLVTVKCDGEMKIKAQEEKKAKKEEEKEEATKEKVEKTKEEPATEEKKVNKTEKNKEDKK